MWGINNHGKHSFAEFNHKDSLCGKQTVGNSHDQGHKCIYTISVLGLGN